MQVKSERAEKAAAPAPAPAAAAAAAAKQDGDAAAGARSVFMTYLITQFFNFNSIHICE